MTLVHPNQPSAFFLMRMNRLAAAQRAARQRLENELRKLGPGMVVEQMGEGFEFKPGVFDGGGSSKH